MGRNDLFLDSGVIYGSLDFSDTTWHRPCKDHFKKFPRNKHTYFSVKRIIEEEIYSVGIKRVERKLIKSKILRLIVLNGEALFNNKEINDIDYIEADKEAYASLYRIIHELLLRRRPESDLNPKDRDAHLLTNAFLWDNKNQDLHNPHFITTDNKDIKKNEKELISEATVFLGIAPHICFCLITKYAS